MTPFVNSFNTFQQDVYNTEALTDGIINDERELLLIMCELAAATGALRKTEMEQDHHIPEFTEMEAEIADIVLRCMKYASTRNLRLAEAIEAKAAFNKNRPLKANRKF